MLQDNLSKSFSLPKSKHRFSSFHFCNSCWVCWKMMLEWHKTELVPLLCPPQPTIPVTPKSLLNPHPGTEINPRDVTRGGNWGTGWWQHWGQGWVRTRGQLGWGWDQPGIVWDVPAHRRELNWMRFKLPPAQIRLGFLDSGAALTCRCSTLIPAPSHTAWQGMGTPRLCLRFLVFGRTGL